jgi:hypothetical protein
LSYMKPPGRNIRLALRRVRAIWILHTDPARLAPDKGANRAPLFDPSLHHASISFSGDPHGPPPQNILSR